MGEKCCYCTGPFIIDKYIDGHVLTKHEVNFRKRSCVWICRFLDTSAHYLTVAGEGGGGGVAGWFL